MWLYECSVVQFGKMLANLDGWLQKAAVCAEKRSFEKDVYLSLRLAPDQFALVRQIQAACDSAKFSAARLTGKAAPSHPDAETSLDALRQRIASVREYLSTFEREDFAGAEERPIELSFLKGKPALGKDYFVEFAQPNFYFHLSTAYAI